MNEYLVPLLICILFVGIGGWALRRRPIPELWRGHEYRAVLDSLEDAILVYDESGQPIYLNRAARVWFGLDEAESYETQPLRTQISPLDDFFKLLSQGGRASFKIGPRSVEAVAQRIAVQGSDQTTVVLHDVTASQDLLAQERRRVRELGLLNEINQAINASLNLDQLLNDTLEKLEQLVPYTTATVSLWDDVQEQLVVKSCRGPRLKVGDVLSLDEGPTAQVMQERTPLLLNDLAQASNQARGFSFQSYVGVPLLAGPNFIGTLELFGDRRDAFSKQALGTLRVVASQAAAAIENIRLYNETLVRADQMATLNTISTVINSSLNLDELLEIIVYSITQVIRCDRSAIFLMDSERGLLSLAKSRGLSKEYIRQSQNMRPELKNRAQVVLDRYPLVVNDIRQAETLANLVPLAEQEGFVALVDFPLRGREHVLGVLSVYYDRPHTFDESEMELLNTFANQVTMALENARLYERTDRALARRVDQLAAIEEIGRELASTLDLNRVFNLVLQRAMGSTGASAGLLALCAPDSQDLALIADRGYPPGTLDRYRDGGWPTDRGIIGRVTRTGEMARVNDVHADPDYVHHVETTCAQLAVPIIKERRVLGLVSLESGRPQGFSADDARFTTQLTELAAIAIDNARLFQQVRAARDNLQAILDSTYDGILVVDRDARIVLANPMIEKMSGLLAEDLVGRRARTVVDELGPRVTRLLGYPEGQGGQALGFLETTSDRINKRIYEMPGPSPSFVEQVASPVIDKDGAVVGRLIVFRDITEERLVDQMRQDLTDMIIHDLRSPLTAVMGGLQVAGDLLDSSAEPAMIHHALDMADESCDRLMSLVDSLLDISRLEAGQMPLERQPVLLPQLAQSVIQQLNPLAQSAGVTLQLETDVSVLPVEADYNLISRVLTNLMDNALKHSPQNGLVTVRVTPESERDTPCPERPKMGTALENPPMQETTRAVRCTVLDQGPGIPPEFRETIFRRFAQLGGRRRGTGLGLAFCKLAVQAHGGKIWVRDNPEGQGSAFHFTLPVISEELLPPIDQDTE